MWPDFLRKYFGFTKQQGRGLFVLVLACILLFMIRLLIPLFDPPQNLEIQNLPLLKLESGTRDSLSRGKEKPPALNRFPFDPNLVSYEQLLDLGFKRFSAKALLGFRKKGFVFRKKEDLLKVYGVDERLYSSLVPYILIAETPSGKETAANFPQTNSQFTTAAKPAPSKKRIALELNRADSLALLALPGIGPSFSKRILKYRSLLGGFSHTAQLLEVYGLGEELFQSLSELVYVDPTYIRKLRLNQDDFKVLNRHPYLSYEHCKAIAHARRLQKLDSLQLKSLLGDEALYQQLRPYCDYD